jgi:HAD superfamily hydrolase (TIGR01509 family)
MTDSFDAIFFDNDGVLVDTEPLFLQASQEVFATIDIDLRAEDYQEISMRRGGTIFDLATERGVTDESVRELRAIRARRYAELIDQGVRVLDGVAATLESLVDVHRTAIVTSSHRDHFDRIHAQTGLVPYFEFVLADGDYTHHKPHPEPYRLAAERMGVDPARCLVIEDAERGLVAAREAGMACVVIPNGLASRGDFSGALARLDSMEALPAWLGLV